MRGQLTADERLGPLLMALCGLHSFNIALVTAYRDLQFVEHLGGGPSCGVQKTRFTSLAAWQALASSGRCFVAFSRAKRLAASRDSRLRKFELQVAIKQLYWDNTVLPQVRAAVFSV